MDNFLSWWNFLPTENRVIIIAGIFATIIAGLAKDSIIAGFKRTFGKKDVTPAPSVQAVQQTQNQQVFVTVASPQPVTLLPPTVEPVPTSTHTAPIPRTPQYGFVARYDDQGNDLAARVSQLLKQDRAVALVGSGGVGKTTLAAEIARAFLPSPATSGGRAGDGGRVVWASADGRADFALTTLLDEAATQLGNADLRALALEQKTNAARELLGRSIERPYSPLLVLDNFETIAVEQQKAIAAFVNTLSGPALITSRLAVEGADRVGVGAMSPEEARDFLTRLIANSPKRNALTRGHRVTQLKAADEIAAIAERNPMVMRWIVGQLELAQRMSDVLDELSHGAGDAATRVFGRSFGLLSADAQAALLSLALCVPSTDRAALAFTAGFGDDQRSPRDIKRLNAALKQLAGLQLLETDEKSERLSVVGLTRRFTSAQLDRDSNATEYRKRFVDCFVRYAEAHAQTKPEDFDALEAERENLFAAMDIAFAAKDWQNVMRVMDAIGMPAGGFLSLHGYWDDAIARGEQAAEAARRAGNESAVARFAGNAAVIPHQRGEYEKAREIYLQVLEIYKRLNEELNVAVALHQLGMIAQDQGDYETARQRYAESLEIKKKLGNQSGIAITLHQLGMIAQKQGDYETARARYAESLEIAKKLGDQSGIAQTLHQLGRLAQIAGDYETARKRYVESLEIKRKLGNQSGIAITLHELGNIAYLQGDYDTARQRYAESLEIAKKLGDQSGIASSLHQLGMLAEIDGNKTEAARLFRETLEIFERLKSPDAKMARESLERVTQR